MVTLAHSDVRSVGKQLDFELSSAFLSLLTSPHPDRRTDSAQCIMRTPADGRAAQRVNQIYTAPKGRVERRQN